MRKKNFWIWIIFAAVVIYCGISIVVLSGDLKEEKALAEEKAEELEEINNQIEELKEDIEYMDTDEYIEKVARERLGMVYEDEIVFKEKDAEGESTDKTDDTAENADEGADLGNEES